MGISTLNKVRWGIIGVGDVTELKSGPAFYKTPYSELTAVMRRNPEKAADYARRHNVKKWYADAGDLIADPEVDAVYIATPPDSHASYAIRAMRAGKPVYVEKPMARNYSECLEMIRISEETKMPLNVAYYRRALPAFLKVRELIVSGTIGKPLLVRITLFKQAQERGKSPDQMHWHVFPEVGGAGHFFDLASHQFDFLDFLFGPVTLVSGYAANHAGLYPAEDTVTAAWQHENGVLGTGAWCFVADSPSETDTIEITGESGQIVFPCFAPGTVRLTTGVGITEMKFTNPEHISQPLVKQVVEELRGFGKCVSTGISAARTSRVLDKIVENYYPDKK